MNDDTHKLHYTSLRDHRSLFESGIPILCYHKISERPPRVRWRSLYVSPILFAWQMDELVRANYTTADLSVLLPAEGNPARKVIITFDDGYANVLTNAAPILEAHNMRATLFIVSGAIGGVNHWDIREAGEAPERLMDVVEIREWLSMGHAIGSHSVTHSRLLQLPSSLQKEELTASKKLLEDTFGVPVTQFCYPYGETDDALQTLVLESGYNTACTQRGGVNNAGTKRSALMRLEVRYAKRSPRAILQRFWWRWKSRE